MKPGRLRALLLACLCGLPAVPAAFAAVCTAQSGERRAVLLELYTSEGCDSCPPADRRLSQFRDRADYAGRLVPLAFHVDYWDRLGWTDRFASPRYTERQQAMATLARSRLVYTPQFLRNGRDWRSPGSPLDDVGDVRPGARIALQLEAAGADRLVAAGEIVAARPGLDVWLALYENRLESAVGAGENAGKTLRHDYVVRRLLGPLAPDASGRLALRREIALEPVWKRADLGVVVFVQDRATGEVVQALQRHACPA
jgi:hypothetical protein